MKLITSDEKNVIVKNCAKPKMKGRGRTWDRVGKAIIDGEETQFYADTTWGKRFYFKAKDKWYCGEIWDVDTLIGDKESKMVRGSVSKL